MSKPTLDEAIRRLTMRTPRAPFAVSATAHSPGISTGIEVVIYVSPAPAEGSRWKYKLFDIGDLDQAAQWLLDMADKYYPATDVCTRSEGEPSARLKTEGE